MCERIAMPDGGVLWICGGRRFRRKCVTCGTRVATRLCDGPKCDVPLCEGCTHARGDADYCDRCVAGPQQARLAL